VVLCLRVCAARKPQTGGETAILGFSEFASGLWYQAAKILGYHISYETAPDD
jgi:hypothetical protein